MVKSSSPEPEAPQPPQVGSNKTVAAVIAGSVTTLVLYGLSLAKITPPDAVATAFQTLITALAVYLTPHGGTTDG